MNNHNTFLQLLCVGLAVQSTAALIMPFRREFSTDALSSRGLKSASLAKRTRSRHVKTNPKQAIHRGKGGKAAVAPDTSPDQFNFTNVNLASDAANIYVGTLSIDGQSFEVQLDTGSSDLWLDTQGADLSSAQDIGIPAEIGYADGTVAAGPVLVGQIKFGDFVVEEQAFISAPGSNATTNDDRGLMGIGPPMLSNILTTLTTEKSDVNGQSFLDNIFSLNPKDPNFISFALSRSANQGQTDGGVFTIGQIPTEYSDISNSPQLPVDPTKEAWVTEIDSVVINGQQLTTKSGVPKPTGLLDSGTGLTFAPQVYVDAMYKDIPGAEFSADDGGYTIPCDSQVEIAFVFGGETYPVHPIDAIFIVEVGTDGTPTCAGSFFYSDPTDDRFDFLLGDVFLRNTYSLFEFGTWTSSEDSAPYIQLLSITDATAAAAEFETLNNARLSAFKNPDDESADDSDDDASTAKDADWDVEYNSGAKAAKSTHKWWLPAGSY